MFHDASLTNLTQHDQRLIEDILLRVVALEGLGGYGELVTEPDQIRPALQRAFDAGVPACINVMVDAGLMRRASYLA